VIRFQMDKREESCCRRHMVPNLSA
jgi:hypothetical protein